MTLKVFVGLALASVALSSHSATTISQFNFNSVLPDANVGTGSTAPSTGAGSLLPVGGITTSFVTGGGTDTQATDNSALQTTGYPAAGSRDKTAGLQFLVSTVGYSDITFSYDVYQTNTSSKYSEVQYTVDGTNYLDAALITAGAPSAFATKSVDLGSFAGVANNASFGVRVVSTFAPGTAGYAPTNGANNYAGTGNIRFDAVTFTGAAISAVPEADGVAMSLAGFAALGALVRRRRSMRSAVQG